LKTSGRVQSRRTFLVIAGELGPRIVGAAPIAEGGILAILTEWLLVAVKWCRLLNPFAPPSMRLGNFCLLGA
jgi:hypothetical protein